MSKRKFQLFFNNLMSKVGVFVGIYLGVFPFLIMISVSSGIMIAFFLPTISLILVLIVTIPQSFDEADRQIYYENQETLYILKGEV